MSKSRRWTAAEDAVVRVNRHDVAARVAELYERMGTGTEVAA